MHTRHSLRWLATISLVCLLSAGGCSADARRILDDMSKTYRSAAGYSDEANVRIRYVRNGSEVEQTIPFRVVFQRPDRVRIDAYDARITVDGTTLRAAVGNVPGQVLEENVRSPLELDQLFSDEQVRLALAEGDAGCPTQLPLLLADDTVDLIIADAIDKPRDTGSEQVEGHACTMITIPKADGPLVLWIDKKNRLLRRLSLPTATYAQYLAQQGGPVGGLAVIVDFVGAQFRSQVPEQAFAFEVPPGAARVARLEPPAPPQPPSSLIGKPCPAFSLATLDGKVVTPQDLGDRPAVLEFFFADCERCPSLMPLVTAAVREKAARDTVRHHAVSVDEADVSDDILRTRIRAWGGPGSILRDPRSVAATALLIDTFPTVVVIAPDGTVADVLVGHDHRMGEDVNAVLDAIAAGRPTAPLVRDRFETRLREHRQLLDRIANGGTVERLPEQVIAPRRQPDRFKLVRAWRTESLTSPGNVFCVDATSSSAARIIALDGWRTVVIFDGEGREIDRQELDIPSDAAVGFLRTGVDAAGKRWWLGGNRGGQQVFVFDDQWKLCSAFPVWDSPPHAGISAADLVDLDGDGTPEIVAGYRGTVGLQAANLSGHRLWKDRSLDAVIDLVAGAREEDGRRGIVCIDGRGRLAFFSPEGQPQAHAGNHFPSPPLRAIFAGPVAPEGEWATIGLAGERLGQNLAIGLGTAGESLWSLALPDGVHRDGPIDPVAWADLLGTTRRQWLIAAPDGSVTICWADGRIVDRYRHGEPITGIGGYRAAGQGFVVLATRDSLEAYRIDDVALD